MKRAAILIFVALCQAVFSAGCRPEPAAQAQSKPPAAKVAKPDGSLVATLTISEEARSRLGLRVAPVKLEPIRRTRVLAGFVQRASDGELVLRAPFAGVVHAPKGGMLRAGARVQTGAELLYLEPWVSPPERVQLAKVHQELGLARAQASAGLERAKVREASARIALDRAAALLAQDAGSARANDEARAEHDLAVAELNAGRELERSLAALVNESVSDATSRVPLRAPFEGQLLAVTVVDGQSVESGAMLLTLARNDQLWLRVPIYSGDIHRLQTGRDVSWTSGGAGEKPRLAHPIDAPPSANPALATVDAWYAIDAGRDQLRPGQRLEVTLTEQGDSEALAVPWSAVLYDLRGETWVYVRVAELSYERRHVQIERRVDDLAVLSAGLAAGAEVVVEAAAELFGLEFGSGK